MCGEDALKEAGGSRFLILIWSPLSPWPLLSCLHRDTVQSPGGIVCGVSCLAVGGNACQRQQRFAFYWAMKFQQKLSHEVISEVWLIPRTLCHPMKQIVKTEGNWGCIWNQSEIRRLTRLKKAITSSWLFCHGNERLFQIIRNDRINELFNKHVIIFDDVLWYVKRIRYFFYLEVRVHTTQHLIPPWL